MHTARQGETGPSNPPQRHIDNCREIASSESFGSRTTRWIGGMAGRDRHIVTANNTQFRLLHSPAPPDTCPGSSKDEQRLAKPKGAGSNPAQGTVAVAQWQERWVVTPETPVQLRSATPREVAQWVEHRSHKPECAGSTPAFPTTGDGLGPGEPPKLAARGSIPRSPANAGVALRKSLCFVTRTSEFDSRLRLQAGLRPVFQDVAQWQSPGFGNR